MDEKKILQIIEDAAKKEVTQLALRDVQLSELPSKIGQLTNLTRLVISDSQLRKLPPEIGQLTNLTALYLSSNPLNELPPEIGQLTNLTILDLSETQLNELPPEIGQLTNLKELILLSTQLSKLPTEIGQLTNLTRLNISSKQLANTDYPDHSYNQLDELPPEIGQLTNLTELVIGDNQLSELPPEIGKLSNLAYLDLSYNQLIKLPREIGKLTSLVRFVVSDNYLEELPPEIGQLVGLRVLDLSDNYLEALPPEIGKLTSLIEFDFSYNQVSELPSEIVRLTNLIALEHSGNPLEIPPVEVIEQGIETTRDYFRQKEEAGIDYLYEAKLLIVGEPGAGKTTLARKIKYPSAPMPAEDETTTGIDIERWQFPQLDKPNFQVNIWDFGGQAIYHATHRFFLTRRSLYILVADTRKDNTDFYYWLNIVEVLSDNSPVLIIKNEKDDRPREINEKQLRGQFVNLKEVLQANLKTNRGLDEIHTHIQQYISHLPHVGDTLPKTWMDVRRELETNPNNYINLIEYLEICQRNGFKKHQDKLQLSTYLHELGICLHLSFA